ncbi:MAG: hypothetical protein ACRDI2_10050 [Chloroflexota bacterium]
MSPVRSRGMVRAARLQRPRPHRKDETAHRAGPQSRPESRLAGLGIGALADTGWLQAPGSDSGRLEAAAQLQRTIGNHATQEVLSRWAIQAGAVSVQTGALSVQRIWYDAAGTRHDGEPPDKDDTKKWQFVWSDADHRKVWRLKAATATVTPPKPAKNYNAIFLKDPSTLRFSQDSIDRSFTSGESFDTLISDLKAGRKTAASVPPIRLVERKGMLITLDNRRLYCFKEAGVQIRCRWAKPSEVKNESWKFTAGKLGKATIVVRK